MTGRAAGASDNAGSKNPATAWISRGFEELVYELESESPDRNAAGDARYDVVVVGSGYGGAIAARELAGCIDTGCRFAQLQHALFGALARRDAAQADCGRRVACGLRP